MVERGYGLVWTKASQKQLRQVFNHISEDSPRNAAKVINDIADAVYKAVANPEIYGPNKYKADNDGSYRALGKHHYRISYRFAKNVIRVLRVRYTSMEPLEY